jgi:hypothetical protein
VYNTEYPIAEGAQYFEYLDVVVGSDDLCYFIPCAGETCPHAKQGRLA